MDYPDLAADIITPPHPPMLRARFSQFPRHLPRRSVSLLASLPAVLVPPVVFGGLLLSLWTYKCAMMVLFQNKIIYMPGVPLGAKRETVAAYRALCGPICWQEHHRALHTLDGKRLSTVSASTRSNSSGSSSAHILVVYFQGNASSSPPRLPHLSAVLAAAAANSTAQYSFLVPSYRGYWTSTGSPSQAGIERDLAAVFTHLNTYGATTLILWGQSIGCGIALTGWANEVRRGTGIRVAGVVLETPFVSVPSMLRVLYPQRWLPYRYLAGLLWSSWDVRTAAADLVARGVHSRVLLVSAGRDEVVPEAETRDVERVMQGMGEVHGVVVRGALHAECVMRPAGRAAVVAFLKSFERADGI